MMEQVKVGLLGLLVVIGGVSIYQNSQLSSKMDDVETNVTIKVKDAISNIKVAAPAPIIASQPVTPAPIAKPPLPSTINETVPTGPTTGIAFTEESHTFGDVAVDSENLYAFEFKNTGDEPLIITNAKGSCGCTVPQWPTEPILPGKTGIIDVKFTPNKGQVGQKIEKTVTVTANTSPASTMVRIKANVVEK
jgi:hypothetical protein